VNAIVEIVASKINELRLALQPMCEAAAERLSVTQAASNISNERLRQLTEAIGCVILPDPKDPPVDQILKNSVEGYW
jgi:hypothetical protein